MNSFSIERRTLLQAMGAAAIAGLAAGESAAEGVPWSAGTEQPKLKAPANACDCHMHIYDSRFPVAPSATLRPADAKPDDYRLLQKRIGTTRNVVVTPSTYGTDNACTLDGMAKREVNLRWQREMGGFFEALEGRRPDESFLRLQEVFHLE